MIERSQSDTIPSSASSSNAKYFIVAAPARDASRLLKSNVAIDLPRLEIEITRAMHKVPIGSSEGRRLFAQRSRVREESAAAQLAGSVGILDDLPSTSVELFAGDTD